MKNRINRAAAFHEAGHVVARHYTDVGVFDVEARSDGSGVTFGSGELFEKVSPWTGQYAAWDELLITLAGPCAEARQSHQSRAAVYLSQPDDWNGAEKTVQWLVKNGFAKDRRAAFARAHDEVANFLRSEWPTIERIAQTLLKQGRLTAEEVESLCEAARTRPAPPSARATAKERLNRSVTKT